MAVVAILALIAVAFAAPWPVSKDIPRVVVNLDTEPELRYNDLVMNIINTYGWEGSYQHVENYWEMLPKSVQDFMDMVSSDLFAYIPEEYARELLGIEQIVQSIGKGKELPLKEIVALNLLYEWTTACTSIIAQDSNGTMWHARNLDWNFGGNSLYNMSAVVDYQSKGKTVYTTVTWIAYVGVLSGSNPNFTVTIDQRSHYESEIIFGNMEAMTDGANAVAFQLRQVLDSVTSFSTAVSTLATAYIAAPVYYNIGGSNKGEGAIISRDRFGNTTDIWKWGSGPQPCCPDIQNWYLVETNYDHWTTDGDTRQEDAIGALNKLGPNGINPTTLFQVLNTPMVFNDNTQYSMVVQNGGSYFKAIGWQ